ncbi:hypothetical protein Q3G72_033014 [Acer saccharum]|nr:hypothetical protein Q3G72_033014 [Acer saccharum]
MNILCGAIDADTKRKIHFVYMVSLAEGRYSPSSQHLTMLQEVVTTRNLQAGRNTPASYNKILGFHGFNESTSRKHDIENNIIVGVIDSGIWPESKSFSDEGFDPPPEKWKGDCSGGENFTCNKQCFFPH